jgi:hypothetical protein
MPVHQYPPGFRENHAYKQHDKHVQHSDGHRMMRTRKIVLNGLPSGIRMRPMTAPIMSYSAWGAAAARDLLAPYLDRRHP